MIQVAEKKAIGLLYPTEVSVNFSQLQFIKIDNRTRPEKQRLIRILDITGMTTLGVGILGLPAAIAFLPVSSIAWVAVPAWGLMIVWVVVDLALETKKLNCKRTWVIKTK